MKHYSTFQITSYTLTIQFNELSLLVNCYAEIVGIKSGRPSSRIALKQPGVKVLDVKVVLSTKKGPQDQHISRVVHHHSYEEIRLHSEKPIYNGEYNLYVKYQKQFDDLDEFKKVQASAETNRFQELESIVIGEINYDTTSYTIKIAKEMPK